MILCPNCKKEPLYLNVTQNIVFTIREVTLDSVAPDERVDEGGRQVLECLGCGWRGWVRDYHQAMNGIIKLFCREEKGVDFNEPS